jgi:DNA-directed RNA polymerase subunit RPC12/RpoP
MQTFNQRNISCPHCDSIIIADLLLDDGKGYLQQGFVTTCSHCGQRDITKAVLAHRKLAADLAVMPINNAQSRLA